MPACWTESFRPASRCPMPRCKRSASTVMTSAPPGTTPCVHGSRCCPIRWLSQNVGKLFLDESLGEAGRTDRDRQRPGARLLHSPRPLQLAEPLRHDRFGILFVAEVKRSRSAWPNQVNDLTETSGQLMGPPKVVVQPIEARRDLRHLDEE